MRRAAKFEKFVVAGGVESQEGAAVLEALGPLGPAAGGVFARNREDGRAPGDVPGALELCHLRGSQLEEAGEGFSKVGRLDVGIDRHRRRQKSNV